MTTSSADVQGEITPAVFPVARGYAYHGCIQDGEQFGLDDCDLVYMPSSGFWNPADFWPISRGDSVGEVDPEWPGMLGLVCDEEDQDTDRWRLPLLDGADEAADLRLHLSGVYFTLNGWIEIEDAREYYHLRARFDPFWGVAFEDEDENGVYAPVPIGPHTPLARMTGLCLQYGRPGSNGRCCPVCGGAGFQSFDCHDCGR